MLEMRGDLDAGGGGHKLPLPITTWGGPQPMSWTDYMRLLEERNTDPEDWAAADLLLLFARKAPAMLTTQQVAERLHLGYSTVTLWCRQGLFPNATQGPATGPGAVWLIPESDLTDFQRPKPGYPKGRPRKADSDPETGDKGDHA